MTTNHIAYLRVSTDEQTTSGAGLHAQYDACQAYALRTEGVVTAVHSDEGVSGSTGLEKRPGLLQAVGTLKKGDVLLVAKRDRLGRDVVKVAMIEAAIERKGARVVSCAGEGTESDDPTHILMRRMIDAFAEYERLLIGARTKAALDSKKSRNERLGTVPFGYQTQVDGIHLEENPEEQQILALLVELKEEHGMSYAAIARELNARGTFNRAGNEWKKGNVHRIYKTHCERIAA